VATDLRRFFDPDYYRGTGPVFGPSIFHTTREYYLAIHELDEHRWPPPVTIPAAADASG
jgi:hypothetical protein